MSTPSIQLGPFQLADAIGEGGMGTVYRATHDRTGVDVALKVVKDDGDKFRRQFHREVQAHAGLVHPGIVYLFDYGDIDEQTATRSDELTAGSPWVAMELADRGTVRDHLPLTDWHEVRDVLVQTLDALAYSHARDVVHRDLKPENLLVFDTDDGSRIKLADFGIAHAFDDVKDRDTDQLQSTAGTPLYMAPEQIRGRWREYGPGTDLYALGCITYQLVCGKPPFVADNPVTLTVHHCNEPRPALDPKFPVPDRLEDWIRRAMAIDPDDRFQRAADAARALPVGKELPRASRPESGESIETMETIAAETKTETLPETEVLTEFAATEVDDSGTSPPSTSRPGRDAPGRSATSPAAGKGSESSTTSSPATSASGGSGPTPPGGGSMGALPDWRTDNLHKLPTPLVGTGLGLFGLRETPFVDRDDERNSIWQALNDVVTDDAFRLVLLSGQSGTGKSRLARWMTRRADEVGAATVLKALHTPGGEGRNEGLAGLVVRAVQGWRLDRAEFYDHLLETLPTLEDENDFRDHDAKALTELVFPTDRSNEDVDGPRYKFGSPDQKFTVVGRLLERLGDHRRPLLWLDDLQWSSEVLGFVQHLADRADRPAALVIATVRSDVLAERPRIVRRIDQLKLLDKTSDYDLEPLSGPDHRRLINRLLPLAPDLADKIAARTEGNPLFAHQLIGELVDDESLIVSDRGFETAPDCALEIPDDIYELWGRRIRRLLADHYPNRSDRVGQILEIAAALGREVDPDEWRVTCRQADLVVPDELVDQLVERGLAEWTDDGWTFAHGMLADSLRRYARQTGRYSNYHRACVQMLQKVYSDQPKRTARRRANHLIKAGDLEEALDPLLVEAKRLTTLGDARRRQRVLERRQQLLDELDITPTARPRLENDVALTNTKRILGELDTPLESSEQLLERCLNIDVRDLAIECLRNIGNIHSQTGSPQKARRAFERGFELAEDADAAEWRADLHISAGWHAFYYRDFDTADEHASRALERTDDDISIRLGAERLRSWVLVARGCYAEARTSFEELLDFSTRRGIHRTRQTSHTGLGDIARYTGDHELALQHYRKALELAESTGEIHSIQIALTNIAQTTVVIGRFDQTDVILRRLDETTTRRSNPRPYLVLIRRGVRLATAAGRRDWATFDEHFESLADGWSTDFYVTRDHPWLLEQASSYCIEADQTGRATRLLEIALQFWTRLGDDEAVDRIEHKLESRR